MKTPLPIIAATLALTGAAAAQPVVSATSAVEITLATESGAEKRVVDYECEGLEPFSVEYINAAPNFLAIVPVNDETLVFSAVLSASGAKYAASNWEWWTSGPEASLYDLTQGEEAEPVATCLEINMTP
jgi:membrane-bound inhibitor of C-type lysozyme